MTNQPAPNPPAELTGADWTDDRAEELKNLQTLINEVGKINHGSGACERIRWCEMMAETLSRVELEKPRDSFIQFLVTLACKDRQRAKSAKGQPLIECRKPSKARSRSGAWYGGVI
jgi:hypothetical protein